MWGLWVTTITAAIGIGLSGSYGHTPAVSSFGRRLVIYGGFFCDRDAVRLKSQPATTLAEFADVFSVGSTHVFLPEFDYVGSKFMHTGTGPPAGLRRFLKFRSLVLNHR